VKILREGDPRLRKKAEEVVTFDENLRKLVEELAITMYEAQGCGLAAPQVGENIRLFLIDVEDGRDLKVFVNPTVEVSKECFSSEEGCLSIPGKRVTVKRAKSVKVKAFDEFGKPFELEAEGLLAVAIQHENDHLIGVLISDKKR
jgi:peptide deformylase